MTMPADVIERGRAYLQRESAALSIEGIIERVQAAADRLATAANSRGEEAFGAVAADGWNGAECLQHVVGWNARNAQQILYVALSGELPDDGEPPLPASREELLAKQQEVLDSLYAHVREAEPAAYLDVRWAHPFFGDLNWREWLLFLELHCIDHARQIEAMARA